MIINGTTGVFGDWLTTPPPSDWKTSGAPLGVGETCITDIKKIEDSTYSCKVVIVYVERIWKWDEVNFAWVVDYLQYSREFYSAVIKASSNSFTISLADGEEVAGDKEIATFMGSGTPLQFGWSRVTD
jgi:hypothetical protein